MTKREYAEAIVAIVGGEVREVEKNNGVVFTSVTVYPKDSNLGAAAYIDSFYEQEVSVEDAAKEIKKMIDKANEATEFDTNLITDWDKVKDNLVARLFNKLTKAEVSRDAGQYGFDDLMIVPVITTEVNGMPGSIKVTSRMLDEWKKSPKAVIDTALKNIKGDYEIKGMIEMIMDIQGVPEDERDTLRTMMGEEEKMYVISNTTRCYGAIGVILAQEELKERFPNGYVILPSSIHEVICVPIVEDISERELTQMVQEVNMTQVAPEERLADRAFYFAA